ncbi:MAG: hypothetical protein WAQ99_12545 [Pyrinomonadaceae bacterium]
MKNLRRLGISVTLLCALSMTALAGDTTSPPCAPGETTSPPCVAAQVADDESIVPGSTNSPPASNAEAEYSITEIAVDLLSALLLF